MQYKCHGSKGKGAILTVAWNLHSYYLPDILNFNSFLDPIDNGGWEDLNKT